MKFKTQNGWTKKSMLAHVKAEFKGKSVSAADAEYCRYRGANGAKCAVGMFIPDEFYNDEIEGTTATGLWEYLPEFLMLAPLGPEALRELQGIHDGSHPKTTLKEMLHWIEINVE